MTFRSMYEIYIEDMGHRCRQSTIDGKKHVFEKLILPYFENKPINKITPKDIRSWQNELIGKAYSNSYLDRIQNMITALFNMLWTTSTYPKTLVTKPGEWENVKLW